MFLWNSESRNETIEFMKVIVIGGGVTGLACAYRLQKRAEIFQQNLQVQLLESARQAGGIVGTESRDGFLLEKGPDCFLTKETVARDLCEELGLAADLIGTQPEFRGGFIAWKNKLHRIPLGFYLLGPSKLFPLLRSPLLTPQGKWRVLMEPFVPRRPRDDESLASFVRRRLGQEVLERLAQPLVGGIYGADPERLSLRATFPEFLDMEKEGSLLAGLRRRAKAEPLA
jgi:protoporphyrinogen/coproporphyrinogen III oxidase